MRDDFGQLPARLGTMAKPKAPPKLVVDLCRALVAATKNRKTASWMSVDQIRETLGVPLQQLNEAVADAITHNLVRVDGRPAVSLTVTMDGLEVAGNKERD
jgi:hypothetical protein